MSTTRGLLRSGSAATAAQLVRILALQATHIVVRRTIPPDEFAIWSWLEVVFLLLATVRDLGVPTHVLRLKPVPFGTLARVELGMGGLLGLLVFGGAPLLSRLFHGAPDLVVAGLRVLVVYLLLEGTSAIALAWYESNLRIERTLPAELTRTFAYCTCVLGGGALGLGFWSFVVGQIAGQALYCLLLWVRARPEMELVHVSGSTSAIVKASLPAGSIWLLATAVTYVDLLVVGRLFERSQIGLYAYAYGYAFLVMRILQQPIGRALYPALLAEGHDRATQFRAYRLATVLFLAIEVPTALLLATNAELATWILSLGAPKWQPAAPFLALLAFAPIADPLGRFGGELLMARHHDRARIAALVLQLVVLVGAGVGLSLWLGSPLGMAWANLLPVGSIVVLAVLARESRPGEIPRLVRELAGAYLVPLPLFALATYTTASGSVARLATSAAALIVTLAWLWRRHAAEYRSFFSGQPVTD